MYICPHIHRTWKHIAWPLAAAISVRCCLGSLQALHIPIRHGSPLAPLGPGVRHCGRQPPRPPAGGGPSGGPLEGGQEFTRLAFQIPDAAMLSDTSKMSQNDIGNYVGLYVGCKGLVVYSLHKPIMAYS